MHNRFDGKVQNVRIRIRAEIGRIPHCAPSLSLVHFLGCHFAREMSARFSAVYVQAYRRGPFSLGPFRRDHNPLSEPESQRLSKTPPYPRYVVRMGPVQAGDRGDKASTASNFFVWRFLGAKGYPDSSAIGQRRDCAILLHYYL